MNGVDPATFTCATCEFFSTVAATPRMGHCRRHAPTMEGFPPVTLGESCGDHRLDTNKVPRAPKVGND